MFNEPYYWMYTYLKKIKTNDMPAFNACLLMCILQMANIGTILVVIFFFLKTNINKSIAVYAGLTMAVTLIVLNYFLLYIKRETIFEKYENNPLKRKTKGKIYFFVYVLLSLAIFFVALANLVTPNY